MENILEMPHDLDNLKILIKELGIKNVIITNYYLEFYAGSQLVTFDLAKLFKSMGIEVTVVGFVVEEPIISLFKTIDIEVINPLKQPNVILNKNYDLVWGHHWPILGFILFELEICTRYLVASSLSPFEPFETIWMLFNEASLILFNSLENQTKQTSTCKNSIYESHILCNSLTEEWFFEKEEDEVKALNKIAVISNHVPQEVTIAVDLLREKQIKVTIIGLEHKQQLITPQLIDDFDALITIGHSVQKGLARGIPVYCYDRFGGPGWITIENVDIAEKFNFSGRCSNRKLSASEIVSEITSGFNSVATKALSNMAFDRYSLTKNISWLLDKIVYCSKYKDFTHYTSEKKYVRLL